MIPYPFEILRPFARDLKIALFTKEDGEINDALIGTGTGAEGMVSLRQVHGNNILITRSPVNRTQEADGAATDSPDLALTVRTADCQSFIVFEPNKKVIAVLHAGWKGLLAQAIESLFRSLKREWEIRPSDVFVCAGPSLCEKCGEFTDPKNELPGISSKYMRGRHVNLRAIADDRLHALGVGLERFERHKDCTRCKPETYWTWRGGDMEAIKKGQTNLLACALAAE